MADRGIITWKKALKKLDVHWAKGDKDEQWHLSGVHSCGDYHSFCEQQSDLVHRYPDAEGDPASSLVCPKCLFKLGRLVAPMVCDDVEQRELHNNMVSLQERIRLEEYAWESRN